MKKNVKFFFLNRCCVSFLSPSVQNRIKLNEFAAAVEEQYRKFVLWRGQECILESNCSQNSCVLLSSSGNFFGLKLPSRLGRELVNLHECVEGTWLSLEQGTITDAFGPHWVSVCSFCWQIRILT